MSTKPAGITYASVCDGIGAAHVAWNPLGWSCAWTSEIERFPIAVVEQRWGFTNLGDMLKITEADIEKHGRFDLLVGGTPCQSFSVAGLRGGLDDPRGNLALRFCQLAGIARPRWIVWENVPGVLSSGAGEDFGSIIRGLEELGYGVAWRSLDAQYFGLAQRRERVFAVGYLGDWRPACAVLLEPEGMRGDSAPGREAGEDASGTLGGGSGKRGWCDDLDRAGAFIPEVSRCLNAGGMGRKDYETETFVMGSLSCSGGNAYPGQTLQDATAGQLIAEPTSGGPAEDVYQNPVVGPLCSGKTPNGHGTAGVSLQRVAAGHVVAAVRGPAVRRLTPRECERLQGFPDNYTLVQYRGKPAADGPRYAALGNSMAVPVMAWIGQRIDFIDRYLRERTP